MRVSSLPTKSQTKLSTAALRTFLRFFPAIFTTFRRLLLWGSARRCLLASSPCCHAAFISASTPGPAHQPCTPRGHLERGANSTAVKSMTSAMSVAMQVASEIGGNASTIAFATWHQRFGSVISRLRSASFGVSLILPLPPVCCGPAWDADFRVHEILIRFWCLYGGPADINAADESAVRLLCQNILCESETCNLYHAKTAYTTLHAIII